MKVGSVFVSGVLRSPAHRLLSGSIVLIRYTGRRSGRTITTPTQYVRSGDDVVILVGRGADQPDEVLPLLDGYLKRFPRAKASRGNGTLEDVVKRAVMVRCRLR